MVKYENVNDWEIDASTGQVVLMVGGFEVDRLDLDALIRGWLEANGKRDIPGASIYV